MEHMIVKRISDTYLIMVFAVAISGPFITREA
jgi:hypothetical protein